MLLKAIRAVFSMLPARLPEIIYTLLLRPRPLRAVANRTLLKLIPPSVTIEGFKLHLNPSDPVLSSAVAFGIYENYEREVFQRFCKAGDTVIDIGANVGLYSLTAAARVGSTGKIIAIEPHPESFRFLQKTIEDNALSQITPFNVAAGDSRRKVPLFVTNENKADSRIYGDSENRQKLLTEMTDLDSLLAEHAVTRVDQAVCYPGRLR